MMLIKYHREAFHEGEKYSCDDCYYQTGWKAQIEMYNFGCLKLTTLKKFNRVKTIIGMYNDSYLFNIEFDIDFHRLRVFKLSTKESI